MDKSVCSNGMPWTRARFVSMSWRFFFFTFGQIVSNGKEFLTHQSHFLLVDPTSLLSKVINKFWHKLMQFIDLFCVACLLLFFTLPTLLSLRTVHFPAFYMPQYAGKYCGHSHKFMCTAMDFRSKSQKEIRWNRNIWTFWFLSTMCTRYFSSYSQICQYTTAGKAASLVLKLARQIDKLQTARLFVVMLLAKFKKKNDSNSYVNCKITQQLMNN